MKAKVTALSADIVSVHAPNTHSSSSRRVYLALGALTIIGFALRIYRINHTSLWMDEVLMMARADPSISWREFFWFEHTMPHPVWHHGLLKLWMTVFGYTEFQARFVSVLFGTISIPATFLLARRVASEGASLLAALAVTVSYYLIFFSQDVAGYTHCYTAACISYLFFFALCRKPTILRAVAYTVASLIALHVHFQSAFMIAAQGVTALYLGLVTGGLRGAWAMTLRFAVPMLAIAASLVVMADYMRRAADKEYFLKTVPDGTFPLQYFYDFFGNNIALAALAGIPIAVVIFMRIHRWLAQAPVDSSISDRFDRRTDVTTLLVMLGAGLAIPYIFSLVIKPVLFHRYTLYTLPIYLALLAVGFDQIAGAFKRWTYVSAFLFISVWILLIGKDHYSMKVKFDQPREVARFVAEKNRELQLEKPRYVVNHPPLMQFYLRSNEIGAPLDRYRTNEDISRLLSASASGDYFWLVIDGWEAPRTLLAFAASNYAKVVERHFVRGYAGLYRTK